MVQFHAEVEGIAPTRSPLSQVVEAGDLVLLAGQVPLDSAGAVVGDDIEAQARQALANLRRCLAAAGCGPADVVKVTAYLSDLADAPGWNRVYEEVFTPPYPVRTTVGAALPGFLLEVEAIASRER